MAMYPQVYPAPAWVTERRATVFAVVGRLKPGVDRGAAEGEMQSLAAELGREYPRENRGRGVKLAPVAEAVIGAQDRAIYSETGLLLLAISGIVLLIACANVANLQLVRAAARAREFTLRIAIGASQWQLIRQVLVESLLLSTIGGAVGLAAAQIARQFLWPLRPPSMKFAAFAFELDWRVLAYAFGIALLTGIIFGLPSALGCSRSDLANDLKERSAASPASGGKFPPRAVLAVLQLAFSLVAITGAGLFLRSVQTGMTLDPGFETAHLGVISFNCADQGYSEARGREYRRLALERAAAVPGVESVSMAKDEPFSVGGTRTVLLMGRENLAAGAGHPTLTSVTYPGYFQTVRIPVLQGRDFSLNDTGESPRVAIVNDTAARFFWPGEEAVGKVIEFAGENRPVQIVGMVRTAAYRIPGEAPQAMIYLSAQQYYFTYGSVYVRAVRDTAATLAAVQRELYGIDPNLYLDAQTVSVAMRKTLWAQSLSATLLSAFGGLALLLSCMGVYGVTSYGIGLRVREIGVRMALGAQPRKVEGMLLREGAVLVAIGIGLGLVTALGVSRLLESMLVGVSAHDALTFTAAAILLAAVAVIACWLPARAAARIDPSAALRRE
jgi:predicted permease